MIQTQCRIDFCSVQFLLVHASLAALGPLWIPHRVLSRLQVDLPSIGADFVARDRPAGSTDSTIAVGAVSWSCGCCWAEA